MYFTVAFPFLEESSVGMHFDECVFDLQFVDFETIVESTCKYIVFAGQTPCPFQVFVLLNAVDVSHCFGVPKFDCHVL